MLRSLIVLLVGCTAPVANLEQPREDETLTHAVAVPATKPCIYGNGLYCGGNGVDGDASTLFRCRDGALTIERACDDGCQRMPVGQNDQCAVKGISSPALDIVIEGGLFAESAVRTRIEEGLRYSLDRLGRYLDLSGKTLPRLTIRYRPASTTYCSGTAYSTSTTIECPYGYPLYGDNQNYVVNITIHELGHILAQQLIAPPSTRDNCVNEGLASWLAGRYWINSKSVPVDSFRTAARAAIDAGSVYASMDACHLASDAWYKVYASYFEYLEVTNPAALIAVSKGSAKSTYVAGWRAWLGR
jgi:hypothetical protein